MTLKELNELIDKAIENAAMRKNALPKTNALNAEYSLGAIFAYIDLIWKMYGIDAMIETNDRIGHAVKILMERVENIYNA